MRATRKSVSFACCILVVFHAGCAMNPAPSGWLPTAAEAQQTTHGGWMSIDVRGPRHARFIGELIAIERDTVFVLQADGLARIPTSDISRASLASYDAEMDGLYVWWVLGTLSTFSHGALLILSAPVWLLAGGIGLASHSHKPVTTYDAQYDAYSRLRIEELRPYARFPQGLPAGLDRRSLRPKL